MSGHTAISYRLVYIWIYSLQEKHLGYVGETREVKETTRVHNMCIHPGPNTSLLHACRSTVYAIVFTVEHQLRKNEV